jgi:HAD superfamily hydrolase (TIGR01509 family)
MSTGPRAVLFDCDGVIADSEPLHLRAFQEVLAPLGITITPTEYVARYLGFDDRGVFTEALRAYGRAPAADEVAALIAEKARRFRGVLEREARIYPGVTALVAALHGVPLAVVSGALRDEIEVILGCAGIREAFTVIVAAEDVRAGKPDPEGFVRACATLASGVAGLVPAECLVIEDSLAGVEGARRAGMRCVAVTNSYPAGQLRDADLVVPTLAGLTLDRLRQLYA